LLRLATGRPRRAILTMKCKDFKGCADTLRAIRAQMQNDLEPSILAELDSVIRRLEDGTENRSLIGPAGVAALEDALRILGRIIEVAAGGAELISRFWN
jgi:hypothetical protein